MTAAELQLIPIGGAVYIMNQSGLSLRTRIDFVDKKEFVTFGEHGELRYKIDNLGKTFMAFEAKCQHPLYPTQLFAVVSGNSKSTNSSVRLFKTREMAIQETKICALTCVKALGLNENNDKVFCCDEYGAWIKHNGTICFWNIIETEI